MPGSAEGGPVYHHIPSGLSLWIQVFMPAMFCCPDLLCADTTLACDQQHRVQCGRGHELCHARLASKRYGVCSTLPEIPQDCSVFNAASGNRKRSQGDQNKRTRISSQCDEPLVAGHAVLHM